MDFWCMAFPRLMDDSLSSLFGPSSDEAGSKRIMHSVGLLWPLLTPPGPSTAIADDVVRFVRTDSEVSQGKPFLFPTIPAGSTPAASG